METINLNLNFSTTRRVTQKQPNIENNPYSKVQNLLLLPPNPERQGEGGLRTKGYFKCNRHDTDKKNSSETDLSKNHSILPLVTIVTVVFNGKKYLEQTIQSVINQTYDNVEYIIIDGGSTDGTLDIIRKYEEVIDYWVSEPDEGLYDAMNKGIQLGTGEIIGLINSDDWYIKDAISKVVDKYLTCQTEKVIICGSMYRTDSDGNIKFKMNKSEKYFTKRINLMNPVNHPATFVAKNVYATIGGFDKKYKICGDYDLIYRAYYSKATEFALMDDCLACMRSDGLSEQNSLKTLWITIKENYSVRKSNTFLLTNIMIFIYLLIRGNLKILIKSIVSDSLISLYYRYRHGRN